MSNIETQAREVIDEAAWDAADEDTGYRPATPTPGQMDCGGCRQPLHPALAAGGYETHPGCETQGVNP